MSAPTPTDHTSNGHRRWYRPWLLALLGAALALAACSDDPQGDAFVGLKMIDNSFTREVTRVPVGGHVRFSNDGQDLHNAVAADGSWAAPVQGGDGDADGNGLLSEGQSTTLTFDEPGIYPFYCTLHGTAGGEGMAAVLVVGDAEYDPRTGEADAQEPVEEWTGVTRRVPDDHPTIQNAVDAADPGDLVLVAPAPQDDAHRAPDGRFVYKEEVEVTTPYLTIRGTDREDVVVDGEFQRPNAIEIFEADGVAIENLTVRNATENGIFWTGVTGYRGSYVTAVRNGVYGIYAFDSVDGLFEHSYASGSPDAGFYIGQCDPCDAVITDSIAEFNALGYSGTNASGNLFLVDSVWRHNASGIVPNTLDSELLPPFHDVTIAGNLVHDNGNRDAPLLDIEYPTLGNGIMLAGGLDSLVTRNRVVNHDRFGILATPNLHRNFWMTGGNEIRDNVIEGSAIADVAVSGPSRGDDCLEGNDLRTTLPVGLGALASCDGGLPLPLGYELASFMGTVGVAAEGNQYSSDDPASPLYDDRYVEAALPDPGDQPDLPGGADAPVEPAHEVFANHPVDLAAITVPDLPADVEVTQRKEFTVFGIPLLASFWSVFFGLYGYLLPFVLYAAWVTLSLWDLSRREDLGRGAQIGWIIGVLLVPFLGPVAYLAFGKPQIPAHVRGAVVGGGLAVYLVILGIGIAVGGVV